MHPVERMHSVVRAFLNSTSCVYFEPVKRTTYVEPKRNRHFFVAPTVFEQIFNYFLLVCLC